MPPLSRVGQFANINLTYIAKLESGNEKSSKQIYTSNVRQLVFLGGVLLAQVEPSVRGWVGEFRNIASVTRYTV